jgi:hypothetical protein
MDGYRNATTAVVASTMTNAQQTEDEADVEEPTTDHLDDVEDGCGCTEIWEHMSEERESAADD